MPYMFISNVVAFLQKSYEGQHSFEQKLSLMLQRIGVTKPQPAEEQVW